jgi:hypothetical protein
MHADWKPPSFIKGHLIEWRARQYRDPIQRLAYLHRAANPGVSSWPRRIYRGAAKVLLLLVFLASRVQTVMDLNAGYQRAPQDAKTSDVYANSSALSPVWRVEDGAGYEVYSNGLRIENRFLKPNHPRSYVIFRESLPSETSGKRYSNPAGIVFHTSESAQVQFDAEQNDKLKRIGNQLLEYISQNQSYHFVINRFGQVYRMVPETDVANHAGYSVWADSQGVYVNLNHSFLGVSFEAQTRDLHEGVYLTEAQINSGRQLVEMLIKKYEIPMKNCVTHAQVSVDPDEMTIGYHIDGSGDFPFRELGIADNYSIPIPSLYLYGFDFDSRFLMSTGTRMWTGVSLADERLRREANEHHLSVDQYKQNRREGYRTSLAMLKNLGILQEK